MESNMHNILTFSTFLSEGAARLSAKTAALKGPLHELLVGKHLNQGNFPEDYRVEGKKPEDIHHDYATQVFGKNYKNNAEYKSMHSAASDVASKFNKFVGAKSHHRVAWTSQPADHEKETGVKDSLSKADLIVTKGGKGSTDHTKRSKMAVSIKYSSPESGKKTKTNWANHGQKTLERFSGADLNDLPEKEAHKKLLASHKIKNRGDYREIRDAGKTNLIDKIDASHRTMSQTVAKKYAEGLSKRYHAKNPIHQDEHLKSFIKRSIGAVGHTEGGDVEAGKTHLPHIIVKTTRNNDASHDHHVTDVESHVHNYLSHFKNLKVEHKDGSTGVVVTGEHKNTSKRMEVHRTQIYGDQATANYRTSTTLGAEDHKDIDTTKHIK
jgi:hypothetical protein